MKMNPRNNIPTPRLEKVKYPDDVVMFVDDTLYI